MKLEEAIAEVQAVTRVTYPWTGDDFTCAQPEHDPTKTDNAIAAILNAVASGDLIPKADHKPVAWKYRWKIDGEYVGWRYSDASNAHPSLDGFEEVPLYEAVPDHRLAVAQAYQRAVDAVPLGWCTEETKHTEMDPVLAEAIQAAILALADADALADVQALREALEFYADLSHDGPWHLPSEDYGKRARDALQPKPAP